MGKLIIWTRSYKPFRMGGNVNAPAMTEVKVGQKIDLGKGFFGYQIETPQGEKLVVEATTGGIVGSSLKQVKADIAACQDTASMRQQVTDAASLKEQGEMMDNAEFWKFYETRKR